MLALEAKHATQNFFEQQFTLQGVAVAGWNMEIADRTEIQLDSTVLDWASQIGREVNKGALRGRENVPAGVEEAVREAKRQEPPFPGAVGTSSVTR